VRKDSAIVFLAALTPLPAPSSFPAPRRADPIEKCERSLLIMASTLHGKPAAQLVKREHVARLTAQAPGLFARAAIAAE